ncbi:GspE/PulE family protein [Patescibacteria group bacterium]|nr:GspE/PulE family protein [Patescibacteria group bacterium]
MPLPSIDDLIKKEGELLSSTQEKYEKKMEEIRYEEKEEEIKADAGSVGVPYINLKGFPIASETLKLLSRELAEKNNMIPFFHGGGETRIAAIDPKNEQVKELAYQVGERQHSNVKMYLISKQSLEHGLKLYATLPKIKKIQKGVQIKEEEISKFRKEIKSFKDLAKKIKDVSTTDLVTFIIAGAVESNVSDIHIEAEEKDVKVRFRIDGILQDIAEVPKEQWNQIVSRIKLLSSLKLNITTRPQDGRFTIFLDGQKTDVRVSTIPTAYGESVVMRLLRSAAAELNFDDLGFRGNAFKELARQVERPNGMIVATGPTGSGKTTTLYSVLTKLNKPGVKIITLEDPIEYRLEGINQSQMDPSKEYTFANGLKSILRQDPDVIMVGEIRDLETAEIAIQAALTGHLLLSTIHTNSASGAIPRFLSMGVKPFLLAPALNAIIAQRLVRRVCSDCKQEYKPTEEELTRVKDTLSKIPKSSGENPDLENLKFIKGKGCATCSNLGYKGRVGIYEIFIINKEVEQVILSAEISEYKMQEIAVKNGMVTMAQDGLLKALDGMTTIEEVFRVAE